jgi:hypothetical protein
MSSLPRPRFTIGKIMLWTAAFAALMAVPRLVFAQERPIVVDLIAAIAVLSLASAAIDIVVGLECPVCSHRTLRRLSRHRGYYRCFSCRAQLKRFGFGPWLDASGPEDAQRYGKSSEAGVWKTFEAPRDLKGSASGALLGRKRSRDLLDEMKQYPPPPDSSRRLEEAERKVRAILGRRRDLEE